jgi:hypothetical protein
MRAASVPPDFCGADVAAVAEMLKHDAALIDDLKRAHDVHSPADNLLK